jgi:hypothetical protein
MASMDISPSKFALKSKNIAMLIIHGIGEQNPYETLDSFTRGVFRFLRESCGLNAVLSPIMIALKNWTQVGMRITVDPSLDTDREHHIDIFEYYWAPETEDKLNWNDTLKWLVRTDLTPLRRFTDNLQEMIYVRKMPYGSAFWYSIKLCAREIRRVLFLYIPMAYVLLWLLTRLVDPRSDWSHLNSIYEILRPYSTWPSPLVLGSYAAAILMIGYMLQFLTTFLTRRGRMISKSVVGVWFILALMSAILLFLLGHFLSYYYVVDLRPLWAAIFTVKVFIPFATVLVALALRYILTAYVADVAVYVTADAKSKSYVARSAILKGSSDALKRILADNHYDHVVLAGHSLGSVIAYDTINELLTQTYAKSKNNLGPAYDQPCLALDTVQLQKLKGLLTFGSPLDKIHYFFREDVKKDQAIRAQILSMLHSFRETSTGRKYGLFEFTYALRQLDCLVWVNAYSFMDPVSARLQFYEVNDQKPFRNWRYWVPGLAHLSYWNDPDFYSYFVERLL